MRSRGHRLGRPTMKALPQHETIARAESLPPVAEVVTAAAILGIGRTAAYEQIRTGTWPTAVLRLGSSSGSRPDRSRT